MKIGFGSRVGASVLMDSELFDWGPGCFVKRTIKRPVFRLFSSIVKLLFIIPPPVVLKLVLASF